MGLPGSTSPAAAWKVPATFWSRSEISARKAGSLMLSSTVAVTPFGGSIAGSVLMSRRVMTTPASVMDAWTLMSQPGGLEPFFRMGLSLSVVGSNSSGLPLVMACS